MFSIVYGSYLKQDLYHRGLIILDVMRVERLKRAGEEVTEYGLCDSRTDEGLPSISGSDADGV